MPREDSGERYETRAKFDNPLLADSSPKTPAAPIELDLPRLEVVVERSPGLTAAAAHVFDGDVLRIGSHPSNELVLADPTISRFHCRISREGTGWRLADCGSTNGTRLDGVKVVVAELDAEAVLTIGDSVLRIHPASHGRISVPAPSAFGSMIGTSPAMQRVFAMLDRLAASDIDALIYGESGTGKELVASEIVRRSPRASGPLVVVDCGAISPSLVESELFGHVRGAFTGADRDREGAFESADGGTVFLDEIGELPLELQPKLLRALEAREVRRLGQNRAKRVDVRVICATNRDLEREVNRGRFREDLYYRLAKVAIRIPPLRDRLEDVPSLVQNFLAQMGVRDAARLLSPAVVLELQRYDWPGNVRELKNYVERSIVLDDAPPPSRGSGVMMAVSAPASSTDPADAMSVPSAESVPFRIAKEAAIASFERAYIGPLLESCNGNVSKAARIARMDRMYLRQLVQKYGFRCARKD